MDRKIKGFENKALIDPHALLQLPHKLKQNLRKVYDLIEDDHERQYVKSLIDPFHPSSYGVRVPSVLPRETVTFNTFQSSELPSNTDVFIVANMELGSEIQMVQIEAPAELYTNDPVADAVSVFAGDEDYNIHYVDTGMNATQFKAATTIFKDEQPKDLYTKHRVVSTGIRFFKTSVSESESGQLDMHYARDGSSLDETSNIKSVFTRHTIDTTKLYLAGTYGSVRGQAGFVSQCNYRPHDYESFEYRDTAHDRKHALYSDEITPLWLVDITNKKLYPIQYMDDIPAAAQVGIV